jgi:hypothetical protein
MKLSARRGLECRILHHLNYKCSLIQYGDENDSEVLLYTELPTLTILA